MFNLFKCKHPLATLGVQKEQTITPIWENGKLGFVFDNEFVLVTYHLVCLKCGENVKIEHAKTIHGVEAFMNKPPV